MSNFDTMNTKLVLCVGNNVIDFITISRHYPVEDTDRRCERGYWQRGGNASNNCTVLRKLGARVEFFGVLSSAAAFRILTDDLRKQDISTENCPVTELDPPFSSVILAKDKGTRTIVHCNMNFPYVTLEDFKKIDLKRYGWVHFEARNHNETLRMIRMVLDFNNGISQKVIISLDLEKNFDPGCVLAEMVDYVVLCKDLAMAQGWNTPMEACRSLEKKLVPCKGIRLRRPCIICPWGEEGAGCLDRKSNYFHLPAYKPRAIVDTLGAGDTFMAAFIYATYVRLRNLPDAVDFANRTAALKIAHCGYDKVGDVLKSL